MMAINEDFSNIKDALEKLFLERTKYIKSQFILNNLEQINKTSSMPAEVYDKIKSVFIRMEIENGDFQFVDENNCTINLLGIHPGMCSDDVVKLSSTEKSVLKINIEKQLSRAVSKFMSKLKIFSDDKMTKLLNDTVMDDLCLNKSKTDIFKYFTEFVETGALYNNLYEKNITLLISVSNIKYNLMSKQFTDHLNLLSNNAKEQELRAKLFKLKTEHSILSINNKTFDDLLLLYKKMKLKDKETSAERRKLESKLSLYENLKNTEFPVIVKEYISITEGLPHLEWIMKELKDSF